MLIVIKRLCGSKTDWMPMLRTLYFPGWSILWAFRTMVYRKVPPLLPTHANRITWLLIWIFGYSFWLFDYSFRLFDYRGKYRKFLFAEETWFLLFETIFATPNKVLNITNNHMLISNIWIFRTNNGSNNQIFSSIILIILLRLAFVGSKKFTFLLQGPKVFCCECIVPLFSPLFSSENQTWVSQNVVS